MQEESLLSTKPYEPMLNLFAAYANEEEVEVQMMENRPSPGRTPSASRKRKGNEPKCSICSRKRTYDDSRPTRRNDREQAARSEMAGTRLRFEEERKKEMEPRPFTGEIRPEIQERLSRESRGEQYGYLQGLAFRSTVPSVRLTVTPTIPGRLPYPARSFTTISTMRKPKRKPNSRNYGGAEPAV
ncbi:MAG: hypothetical protein ACLUVG_21825 [Phocaeicola vulgatus]